MADVGNYSVIQILEAVSGLLAFMHIKMPRK